ncbi:unnamed protein product [Paramecium primaurelia]|uniref:Uncharacterized protein n=1 Tax=Paramecium primaurelia TaxID=5886 RepID=A0A8S1NAM3_PARPR|nr:unnamed protein product [Paramecium primaurelia]
MIIIFCFFTLALSDCSNNPFTPQYLNLLHNLEIDVKQYNTYILSTPKDQTLTICSKMNSYSCCTTETETFFQSIISKYQSKLLDNNSELQNLLKSFESDIKICGLLNNTSFENSFIGSDSIDNYKLQLQQLAKLQAGFLQGNLCILCAASNDTKFIQNNKIIALKSNYDTYINNLINQYDSLQSQIINFKQFVLDYYLNYTDTLNCSSVLEEFLQSWQNVVVCPGNNCESYIKNTIQPLGFRQLLADDYYIFSETDGIDVYIEVTGEVIALKNLIVILTITFILLL